MQEDSDLVKYKEDFLFNPLPGLVVLDSCPWELKLNTMKGRVPETITEMICLKWGKKCGRSFFSCQQMKTKVMVAFTEPMQDGIDQGMMVSMTKNITVRTGCNCVANMWSMLEGS